MLTADMIAERRETIAASPDLAALRDRLIVRAGPVLAQMPTVPHVKALLSRDGGVCPDDQSPLTFDPWQPEHHRCPHCGRTFSGERHHAHWARAQHLWVAERAAHLATLHALSGDEPAALRARELLAAYFDRYFELPNRDNVLGPSHLFFSTYLESIWALDYFGAAYLLREAGALPGDELARIDAIAEEAAAVIGDFNEGMSNRQTWNSAALAALAAWFGDEELAATAIEDRTGLLGHLADGFGSDGIWFEGENYHLFAMRGLLLGMRWARLAGTDAFDDARAREHFGEALMAPADTALPDFTFPARKDARYGVSLSHPAYLECWEDGHAILGDERPDIARWLRALYAVPARTDVTYDAYLHEAGEAVLEHRSREDLSWWALLTMAPDLPRSEEPWIGRTRLLEQQGLAVMRHGNRYVSLECGSTARGHGHPDRLHLTLHADGVHWLPDPGTGSYVSRDLFWYRSTLAHNAPALDGHDQSGGGGARCTAFAVEGDWTWAVGEWNGLSRSVIAGPGWIADVLRFDARETHRLDLPWHVGGSIDGEPAGRWLPESLTNEFIDHAERLDPNTEPAAPLHASAGVAQLALHFTGDGALVRADAPSIPGSGRRRFYIRTHEGNSALMISVVDTSETVTAVTEIDGRIEVRAGDAVTTIQLTAGEAVVTANGKRITLGGARPAPLGHATYVLDQPLRMRGEAPFVDASPALNGSLRGFDLSAPLPIDEEYQYFRTEEPYPGPDQLAATAYVNYGDDVLYVAVDVIKSEMVLRDLDAPPLGLDNEPEDTNADGVQLYLTMPGERPHGWLILPVADGTIRARTVSDLPGDTLPRGRWTRTARGYCMTVELAVPHIQSVRAIERVGFDVVVNEMRPGRIRRAGQLVWSGGPGWAYLRGDRHDPAQCGELELHG